ncbi:MAG: hypothetical protein NVS1B11_17810 [Terriglobales bacterium]
MDVHQARVPDWHDAGFSLMESLGHGGNIVPRLLGPEILASVREGAPFLFGHVLHLDLIEFYENRTKHKCGKETRYV